MKFGIDELLQSVGNLCSRESLAHRHVNCIHLLNTNDCTSQLPHPHPSYPFLSAVKIGFLSPVFPLSLPQLLSLANEGQIYKPVTKGSVSEDKLGFLIPPVLFNFLWGPLGTAQLGELPYHGTQCPPKLAISVSFLLYCLKCWLIFGRCPIYFILSNRPVWVWLFPKLPGWAFFPCTFSQFNIVCHTDRATQRRNCHFSVVQSLSTPKCLAPNWL